MKIRSKAEFFRLWEQGVLGNRTRLWRDPSRCVEEAAALGIKEIGFRQIGKTGGGAWEKVLTTQVIETADKWRSLGRDFILDDGAPDEHRTLQGEVCRTHRGIEGFLEVGGKLPMRRAIASGLMKHYGYVSTRALLDRYMDPSSRDDLNALWELHPDAAIEFSCFTVNVGVLPRRNTLFWEVRDY